MTNAADSTFGAALGAVVCIVGAYLLLAVTQLVITFHRRGVARLRAHRQEHRAWTR